MGTGTIADVCAGGAFSSATAGVAAVCTGVSAVDEGAGTASERNARAPKTPSPATPSALASNHHFAADFDFGACEGGPVNTAGVNAGIGRGGAGCTSADTSGCVSPIAPGATDALKRATAEANSAAVA